MKKITSRDEVIISILVAVAVVFRIFAIPITESNTVIIHNIPLMILGFTYGPLFGLLGGVIMDLSSLPYQAGWNPFYMTAPIIWGVVPGLLKYIINHRKLWGLAIIEIVTHILASASNKVVTWILYGGKAALGPINVDKMNIIYPWLEKFIRFFSIDGVIYVGVLITILLMVIKIPFDVILVSVLNDRVVDPLILQKEKV